MRRLVHSFSLATLALSLLFAVASCGGGGSSSGAPVDNPSTGPGPTTPTDPPPILPTARAAWHVPTCASVTGAAPVTFTSDDGLHRAPIATPAAANYFTFGVAALAAGSTLAAVVGNTTFGADAEIFFSTDAGCSWQPSGQILPNVYYYLSAELVAAGDHAYIWSTNNRTVHVIEPTGQARAFNLEGFAPWVSGPYGFGVDPGNPARVRIALYDCQHRASCGYGSIIMETSNKGETWTAIGVPAPYIALNLRFSPTNLDHVVAPSGSSAGHVTFDGGNLWLQGSGVPAGWLAAEAAIAVDDQTVWLLVDSGTGSATPDSSAMFVSYDGGLNYQAAFAASAAEPFAATNPVGDALYHARLFPHPSNADVVYLAYTSRAAGTSYLYRYDATLNQLSKQEWASTEGGVWSLAVNPAAADHLYLGLAAGD